MNHEAREGHEEPTIFVCAAELPGSWPRLCSITETSAKVELGGRLGEKTESKWQFIESLSSGPQRTET